MSVMLLIRHATIEGLGQQLVGRSAGVHLTEKGKQEADLLASRLATLPIEAIYSSPRERALETAAAIAEPLGLSVEPHPDLDELDYGNWTGRTFVDLRERDEWRSFNARRREAQIPGGESMTALVSRVAHAINEFRNADAQGFIAVVTHADWIRAAGSVCTNLSLDDWKAFEVDPASVSAIRLEPCGSAVLRWNDTGCWQQHT